MKKRRFFTVLLALFMGFSVTSTLSSCKVKEGCGLEDEYSAKTDKKTGQLSMERGSTTLFDKKRVAKKRKKKG